MAATRQSSRTTDNAALVFDPGYASQLTLAAAEALERNKDSAIKLGMGDEIDRYFLPMTAGDLVSVIALTSNGKSAVMQFIARQAATQLKEQNRLDECVIVVSWEQTIEHMGLIEIGRSTGFSIEKFARGLITDWEKVKCAALEMASAPIYRIGHSIARRKTMPRLTLQNVSDALKWLEDTSNVRPALIVLDYLQAMDIEGGGNYERRLEVRENVYRAKNLAFDMGCPVMMGCQAKQTIGDRKCKLPQVYDGEESAAIAQRSDAILCLWIPRTTDALNSRVQVGNAQYEVTPNLLLVAVAKQKFADAGRHFAFHFDGGRNYIAPLETRRA